MNTTWYVSTKPTSEPVTAAQAQRSLGATVGYNDEDYELMISSARQQLEKDTGRAIITQTITLKLDHWPCREEIHLPFAPVQSITSFSYIDTDGSTQSLVDGTDYEVTITGDTARIIPVDSWPTLSSDEKEVVTVVYNAGYGSSASDVPAELKTAIILYVDWLDSKGDIMLDNYKRIMMLNRHYFDWTIND